MTSRVHTEPREHWGIRESVTGVALAIALAWTARTAAISAWTPSPEWRVALSYLAVWLPLLGAVLVATYRHGQRSFRADYGLRFTWLDILYGLTLGFSLRSIATVIEIVAFGRPASGSISFGPTIYDLWWLLLAVIAPVLVSPIIEELFFRGLMQRSILAVSARQPQVSGRVPFVIAVAVSSLVFAAVHMLQTSGGMSIVAVGMSTLMVGIGVGTLAAATKRLGGAIIAHITFNGLGILGGML